MTCPSTNVRTARTRHQWLAVTSAPTVPTVSDHRTTGWLTTDIYKGEFAVHETDERVWTRNDNGVFEIATRSWVTTTINAALTTATDEYVNGVSFDPSNGNLSLSRVLGTTLVENLDGRYIEQSHAAFGITSTNINNWNTAFGWGDHNGVYYTKSELNTAGAGGAVHWDNVSNKPATFPPSSHNLNFHNDVNAPAPSNGDILQYNGTNWISAAGSGSYWSLVGNAGTSPGTNFIGTTDAQDVQFKSNNTLAATLRTDQSWLYSASHAASSGSVAWDHVKIASTVNGTGTYTGLTSSLHLAPTSVTAITDTFAALRITTGFANNQYAIYQSQTGANTRNYLQGRTGINVLSPVRQLEVGGDIRLTGDFYLGNLPTTRFYSDALSNRRMEMTLASSYVVLSGRGNSGNNFYIRNNYVSGQNHLLGLYSNDNVGIGTYITTGSVVPNNQAVTRLEVRNIGTVTAHDTILTLTKSVIQVPTPAPGMTGQSLGMDFNQYPYDATSSPVSVTGVSLRMLLEKSWTTANTGSEEQDASFQIFVAKAGTLIERAKITSTGYFHQFLPASAPADASIANEFGTIYQDGTTGNYYIKAKDSAGTVSNVLIGAGGGGAGGETLFQTLGFGNTTGGRDIILSAGDDLIVTDATADRIALIGSSKELTFADTATYPDLTELSYLKGATSNLQTQINALGGGGSGDVTAASAFGTDNVLIKSDGTSKGVQATGITIADTTNDMSGVGKVFAANDTGNAVYSFAGKTNFGFHVNASDFMVFRAGGSSLLYLKNGAQVLIGGASAGNVGINQVAGSAATPVYSFGSDGDTGMYRIGANEIGWATGGTKRLSLDGNGDLLLNASRYINFGATYGSSGYGFRDNGGTIEYKHSGGAWTALP